MQERLLSRFRWGLSADLQVPDYDTRIEILERKMKNDGLDMPKEVVKYLAYNINSNVRELEGALISLLAQSSLNKREIDLELAKKVLRNFVKTSSKEITIETIQRMVCEYFDVALRQIAAKDPQTGDRAGEPDYYVPGQSIHQKFTQNHRRTFWRQRSHHGYPLLPNG